MLRQIWREPIVVFLIVGAALFAFYEARDRRDSQVIEVNRNSLIHHIQLQTRSYNLEQAEQRLDRMSPKAVSDLVKEYVREEALYRRAIAHGFDTEDYVIRRRLVQKVEFLAEGAAVDEASPVSETSLKSHYDLNHAAYTKPANLTFTHVFLRNGSEDEALALLTELNRKGVRYTEAGGYGQRFAYHLNYVEREHDLLSSHFGKEMTDALFSVEPDENVWRGPLRSGHGWHLVLVTSRQQAALQAFDDIRDRVLLDVQAEHRLQRQSAYLSQIVAEYDVELASDIAAGSPAK